MSYVGIKGSVGPPGLPGSKELCQSLPGPEGPPGTDGYPGHPGQILKLCNYFNDGFKIITQKMTDECESAFT